MPQLPRDEPADQYESARKERERPPREPAVLARLRDRVDESRETARHEDRADGVERLCVRVAALLQEARGEDQGGRADGHVDVEDPFPTQRIGQHAAEQNPGGCAEAADRAPDAKRDVALTALAKR